MGVVGVAPIVAADDVGADVAVGSGVAIDPIVVDTIVVDPIDLDLGLGSTSAENEPLDLRYLDLSGADLSGADLTHALLQGTNLSNSNLSGADFRSVDLTGANLTGANLSGADLSYSKLTNANFTDVNLSNVASKYIVGNPTLPDKYLMKDGYLLGPNVDLSSSHLRDATLVGVDLSGANLIGANLIGADLSDANLEDADLGGAYLKNIKLVDADLSNAQIDNATIRNADLTNANLNGAILSSSYLDDAILIGADLTDASLLVAQGLGANFSNAKLLNVDFIGSWFDGADFSNAELTGSDARNASFVDANFWGAIDFFTNTQGTRFELYQDIKRATGLDVQLGVWDGIGSVSASPGIDPISTEPEPNGKNLRNSDLSGTDLNGVNLNSANLSGSNLSKSNLEMADLSNSNLVGANLTESNLETADLSFSNLTGANLADAKLHGTNFTQAIVDPDDWDLLSLTQQDEAIRANSLPSGAPIISGLGQSKTLTLDISALSDADGLGVLSFQWFRAGIELLGETSLTYKLSEADIGSVISAKTSYTDGYGNNEKFTAVTEREIQLWDQNHIDPIDPIAFDPIAFDPIVLDPIAFDPIISGSSDSEVLVGSDDDDVISAGDGSDLILAGAGDDTITVGGSQTFSSFHQAVNTSSATQVGTGDKVTLEGMLRVEDVIDGGADTDTIELDEGNVAFFLHDAFSGFHSSVELSSDSTGVHSKARLENIEKITGSDGNNIIDLTSPDYSLAEQSIEVDGGLGADIIWGSDADETIKGGEGNDELFGGAGTNVLTGGAGADEFQFTMTSENDSVTDFNAAEGDTLKFFNTGGATFDRDSVTANSEGDGISIEYSHNDQVQSLNISLGLSSSSVTNDLLSAIEII